MRQLLGSPDYEKNREKLFKIEGKVRSARTFCVDKGYILLNDLAEEEALELYLNSNNGPK